MKYRVSQKIFSLGDKFTIKNELNTDCYNVVGQIFSFGNKLRLYDMAGRELFYIEQKLFRFLPEYYIFSENNEVAKVRKEFTFFKPAFSITSRYGNIIIQGNVFAHEFTISVNGKVMARVSKEWFSFRDSYGVDISDDLDHAFILALIIVIDQTLYDGKRN